MRCLILAAGYATRMYPLTKDFPKPLLMVGKKALLEYLLEDLIQIPEMTEILIVTNHRFFKKFEEWKEKLPYRDRLRLFDDGSTENENRLGAVRDMEFVIEEENLMDDLLVLAGDNLLDFTLGTFVEEFYKRNSSMVMYHEEKDVEKLKKTGVAELSPEGKILSMEEKPEKPKANCAVPPFYLFRKEDIPYIQKGIDEGCGGDSPGSFLEWFCREREVYAMKMPGRRYDIGSMESYQSVCKQFE